MSSRTLYDILKPIPGIFFLLAILYFGKSLFIPLSFALLLSLVLYPVTRWFEKLGWSPLLSIFSSLLILLILVAGLMALLISQFSLFLNRWPEMQYKLELEVAETITKLGESIGIPIDQQQEWIHSLIQNGMEYLLNWLPQSLYATAVNLVLLLLVPFYIVLILFYRRVLIDFLHSIVSNWSYEELYTMLNDSIHTYFNFIKGMSLVYLTVGVLNSVGLMFLGIPNAILFGFIASILTFIPYVGIAIGALLPMTVAWLMYESLWYPLGVVAIFVFVQILEANVIFPLVVSRHLKINALAAILVIVIGGILWGAAGMILFVPFVAILKLVMDHIDKEHPIAIILRP